MLAQFRAALSQRLEVRAGAAAQVNPNAAGRDGQGLVELAAARQQTIAEAVITAGLTGIERLHSLRVVLSTGGLEEQMVKRFQVGAEGFHVARSAI